jgi:glutamate---cysteine ligase / carboxylate-amine ligase
MIPHFTIGIEEEFQMVDRQTGQLSPRIQTIMEKGQALFGEQIKAEMLQSTVEINSDILPDIPTARREMRDLRARLARLVAEEGLVLISAGTHPTALWQNEQRTPHERYAQLEQELQDVARSILIFGLHIHVGIESHDLAVELMNQLRTWLPHLLAISTNSPCWAERVPHRAQVVSLGRLEAVPAQRSTRGLSLSGRLRRLRPGARQYRLHRQREENLVGYPPPSLFQHH